MKEKDLKVDFKDHQLILYSEHDDDSYGPIQTGSQATMNFLDDFRGKWKRMEDDLIKKVASGEISMIYYYMMLEELTVAELATRVGLSKSKVQKHLLPEYFQNIDIRTLWKYAQVFNIPVANLFQLISAKDDKYWKAHYIENEELKGEHYIVQQKTKSPFVVITKIERINS
ncbi:MAG: hypothetical protein HY738_03115 [Bacteroidia bacterium]|nr:hypothetical protein [Bacteroidia bacterium]